MKHRRLFALLASAALLHLTVVTGDAACATHGAMEHRGATAVHAATDAHANISTDVHAASHSDMHAAGRPGARQGAIAPAHAVSEAPPCETPVQPRCCEAQAGCSVVGAIAGACVSDTSSLPPATRVREALHDTPASFASPPEPPPPRR